MAQEQITKVKKKQWYPIVAPKLFNDAVLGETLVYEPQSLIGRTLSHSLMNLTNDMRRQNTSISCRIAGIDGNKAMTSIIGYYIIPSSVRRLIRRNSEKMDMSFACDTLDNVHMRVKPLVITKADVKGSVAAKMRNFIVQHMTKTIKKMNFEDLMNDIISHKLQSDMRAILNKIYPIKVCEIRYAGIEELEKPKEAKEIEAAAE